MRTLRLSRHRLTVILTIAASFRIATALHAQSAAQNPTGSIRVLVQVQGTSEPIAGAQVTINVPPTPVALPAATGTVVNVVTAPPAPPPVGAGSTSVKITDAAGVAVFDRLPPAAYSIRAQRDGYVGSLPNNFANLNAVAPAYATATVRVNAQLETVVLNLAPAGSISGRVKDANGALMSGVRVFASVLGYREGRAALIQGPNAQPDGQGNYRISPIAPGQYYIKVDLGPSRGSGAFYPGVASWDKATLVPVEKEQEVVGVDFDTTNSPTFRVSGKLLNLPSTTPALNGRPNGILGFTFAPADPHNPDFANAPLVQDTARRTNGEFTINLGVGEWNIYPVIPTTSGNPAQSLPTYTTGHALVRVVDRDIENVAVTIGSSDVKVRVMQPPGISITRLTLMPRENIPSPLISHIRSGQTLGANGEIEFKSVPPGKYSIQIPPLANSYVADVRVGSKSVYEDGIISVGVEPLEPVEVVFRMGGGAVQGTVGMDAPASTRRIILVPDVAARRGNAYFYKTAGFYSTNGSFVFSAVPPGDYKAFAFQNLPPGGAEQDETFMAKYESFGTSVKVVDGQTSNIVLAWIPPN